MTPGKLALLPRSLALKAMRYVKGEVMEKTAFLLPMEIRINIVPGPEMTAVELFFTVPSEILNRQGLREGDFAALALLGLGPKAIAPSALAWLDQKEAEWLAEHEDQDTISA